MINKNSNAFNIFFSWSRGSFCIKPFKTPSLFLTIFTMALNNCTKYILNFFFFKIENFVLNIIERHWGDLGLLDIRFILLNSYVIISFQFGKRTNIYPLLEDQPRQSNGNQALARTGVLREVFMQRSVKL